MKKLKLKIPVLLPDVPHEKDQCVHRIMEQLQGREGIEEVHVEAARPGETEPLLCFHYNPEIIPVAQIQALARQAGAQLTGRFGHALVEVAGIRHQRHARVVESALEENEGILDAEVSGSGMIRLEYDRQLIAEEDIRKAIRNENLTIRFDGLKPLNGKGEDILLPAGVAPAKPALGKPTEKKPKHEHKEGEEGHAHEHSGPFGANSELIFSILCGVLLGVGWGLAFVEDIASWIPLSLFIGAYFFGGLLYG